MATAKIAMNIRVDPELYYAIERIRADKVISLTQCVNDLLKAGIEATEDHKR